MSRQVDDNQNKEGLPFSSVIGSVVCFFVIFHQNPKCFNNGASMEI